MQKSLEGTEPAWVSLDKNAKAPLTRDQRTKTTIEASASGSSGDAPPLARPIYRPAPATPKSNPSNDFDDLPNEGEEQTLTPSNNAPPKLTPKKETKAQDSLEDLINKVQ